MTNEHQIFHDRIQSWLSGQLGSGALEKFETHRKECPECASQAQAEKELWELLGEGRIQNLGPIPSVWPQIQQRVFDSPGNNLLFGNGWFFGGGQVVRASLAACAVAAGLMVGVLIPGLSGRASADDINSDLWVSEASWLDETATDGLAGIWLSPGLSDESDGS